MQGTIAAARAHCANSQGDTHSAAEYARRAWICCPTAVPSLKASEVWQLRSLGMPVGSMVIWRRPFHAYTEAIRIGREAGNLHMVIIANSNLGEYIDGTGSTP